MNFREITINDYEKIIPFWNKNYFVNEMDSFEKFKLFLEKNPDLSILAEDNKNIIATALGSYDGRRGYLQKIVVDSKFRKKGIGKKLVETIIDKLRALGCTYITLNVEKELVKFYQNFGFKRTSQIAMNVSFSNDGKYEEYIKRKSSYTS